MSTTATEQAIAEEAPPTAPWSNTDELRWAARHWAARIGVKIARITVRPMRHKWASMSTAGHLTLNAELRDLPRELGEFVLVHELVHLIAPNHGKVFKSFMYAYLPDWPEREQRLRTLAHETAVRLGSGTAKASE
jgi:predicted metal-dependent hydrolase